MPRTAFPPTPASSSDMKGEDGSKLAPLQISFELPPPAIVSADASSTTASSRQKAVTAPSYPTQPSETVKSRRRSSTAQDPSKKKDQFTLPPPPTRTRKIIQMKPRQETAQEARSNTNTAPSPSSKKDTQMEAIPSVAETKRKQPTATSAAGRKTARKTAHSLIERRRRSKMNEEFALLKSMIPSCHGEMHKLSILQASIEYVRYLEDCVSKLKAECASHLAESASTETSLPSPIGREPYNPSHAHATMVDASSPDVNMTSSDIASPTSTQGTSRSQQPSISPALRPEDSQNRINSYSSVSTEHLHYGYSGSSTVSPSFTSLPSGYAQVAQSASGPMLSSPALPPLRDYDQEATAALLMLNQADQRRHSASASGSGTSGRGMSVRDLLST